MQPFKMNRQKKHYAVLLHGRKYSESWARSPDEAIKNVWWRLEKHSDKFAPARHDITEFDAIEI